LKSLPEKQQGWQGANGDFEDLGSSAVFEKHPELQVTTQGLQGGRENVPGGNYKKKRTNER